MRNGRMLGFALAVLLASSVAVAAGPLDINTADAPAIARVMNGVGMSKAEAIVAYRKAHGPFASVEELGRVKGIGPATIEKNRDQITAIRPGVARKDSAGK